MFQLSIVVLGVVVLLFAGLLHLIAPKQGREARFFLLFASFESVACSIAVLCMKLIRRLFVGVWD